MAPRVGLRLLPRSDLRPSFVGSELSGESGTVGVALTSLLVSPAGSQYLSQSGTPLVTTGGGGTAHPNEPAGMAKVTEVDFTGAAELTGAGWALSQVGRLHYENPGTYAICSQFDRLTTATARANYINVASGSGAINISKTFSAAQKGATIYIDFDFGVSDNWDGEPSGVGKIYFICAGGASGQPFYFSAQGAGSGALDFQVRLQGAPASKGGNSAGGALNVSAGASTLTRGTKARIEVVATMNSVDGSGNANADGLLQVWMNGTQKINRTTMAYRGNDSAFVGPTALFDQIKWNPTWGGQTIGLTNTVDMDQFMGYTYVSTK